MKKYAIQQLSVFLENRKGELADVTSILAAEKISIRSLLLLDSTDFGVLRLILDQPQKAKEALISAGYTVRENKVFAVRVEDKVGSFNRVANVIEKYDINILYTYALSNENVGVFVFKVERNDFSKAVQALQAANIEVLDPDYFY